MTDFLLQHPMQDNFGRLSSDSLSRVMESYGSFGEMEVNEHDAYSNQIANNYYSPDTINGFANMSGTWIAPKNFKTCAYNSQYTIQIT